MAAKIEVLVETVAELTHENNAIKKILDMKQTEWVNIESKGNSRKENTETMDTRESIPVENQYKILEIDDDDESTTTQHHAHANTQEQILEYRAREQAKFAGLRQKETNAPIPLKQKSHINIKPKSTNTDPEPKIGKENSKGKRTLVIGDSMVKHIGHQKIGRAAGQESVVHSYSGAKVDQIKTKVTNSLEKRPV